MVDITVPGINRISVGGHGKCHGSDEEFYYSINLQELPVKVAFGEQTYDANNPTLQDFWPDHDLAKVLFDPGDRHYEVFADDGPRAVQASLALADLIAGCELNDAAIENARRDGGFHSRMLDKNGAEIGPTIIFISESRLRNNTIDGLTGLDRRYRRLSSIRTYQVMLTNTEIVDYLSKFYDNRVAHVRRWNERLRKETAPIRLALAKIQNAHLAVTAMLDFSEPPAVRQELWNKTPPKREDAWVFSPNVLPKRPTDQQVSNAKALRDTSLEPLAQQLCETLEWMNSGATKQGRFWETARSRNLSARRLLDELRQDSVIQHLLENHKFVPNGQWIWLESILVDAFLQIATAPDVLPDLLGSEILAIARISARHDIFIDGTNGATVRERELSKRLTTMVPDNELREKETPFSKRLIELHEKADHFKTHSDTFLKLWAASLPPMLHEVGRVATVAGESSSVTKRAFLLRSIFGTGNVPEPEQNSLWEQLNILASSREKRQKALEVFDQDKGSLHRGIRSNFDSETAWNGFKGAVALFALHETLADGKKKPALYAIDGIKAVLEAAGAGLEFAETLTTSPTFVKAAAHRGESLLNALDGVSDHPMFKGLGIATGWLDLVGSVLSAKVSKAKAKTQTQIEKEMAKEKILLTGMELALTIITTAITPMPIASLVLFVGQTMLQSRDKWLPKMLNNVDALPGTGRFVRGAWASIVEDVGFNKTIGGCPWGHDVQEALARLADYTAEVSQSGRGCFWPLSKNEFGKSNTVEHVLVWQYGLSLEAADKIVKA